VLSNSSTVFPDKPLIDLLKLDRLENVDDSFIKFDLIESAILFPKVSRNNTLSLLFKGSDFKKLSKVLNSISAPSIPINLVLLLVFV
jgi:hypothetical protein